MGHPFAMIPLAGIGGPEVMIPLVAILLIFGIPIVAILTKHQQKMALIVRDDAQLRMRGQDPHLANEIRELRELVVQQSLALDNLAESQRELARAFVQVTDGQNRVNI